MIFFIYGTHFNELSDLLTTEPQWELRILCTFNGTAGTPHPEGSEVFMSHNMYLFLQNYG